MAGERHSGGVVAVNAGHPRPYRLRAGRVECLELATDIPFGMIPGSTYREQELQLEPGDRLVVVTDGLLERNAGTAHFDVVTAVAETAALHPREVVHVFKASVLAGSRARRRCRRPVHRLERDRFDADARPGSAPQELTIATVGAGSVATG